MLNTSARKQNVYIALKTAWVFSLTAFKLWTHVNNAVNEDHGITDKAKDKCIRFIIVY